MSVSTKDGLLWFQGYLAEKGNQNTGRPPYTIKAKDLDGNFLRLVCRDAEKLEIVRTSDNQKVELDSMLTFERKIQGQIPTLPHVSIDVVVDGKIRQMVYVGQLVPEK